MAGTLYVVSTPIGNLEDISLRALRLLREANLIAAEDTRHTRKLLNYFQIETPATAYHEHNKLTRLDFILEKLRSGENVALVSDAGTPCLSDPGWELVRACLDEGLAVDAAPGPAAPLVALVLSGFAIQEFTYAGFPPRKKKELESFFVRLRIEANRRPLVFFEAPHRLLDTLQMALTVLGDRPAAIGRELTKLYQEVRRENLSAALLHFKEIDPRGEFTIVLGPPENFPENEQDEEEAQKKVVDPAVRLRELRESGAKAKAAIEIVAGETGLNRRQLYDMWLAIK